LPPSPPPAPEPPPAAATSSAGGELNLNTVTFEQLRAENLSVTQATRLLAHQIAGFPQDVLAELKSRSTL
jgi:hypothetical protein